MSAIPTAVGPLDARLIAAGFRPGKPAHVHPATLMADVRIYRNQRCGRCNRRGQAVVPWHHRGHAVYRLVLTCRSCGHQAEA
jgi:hypothetical protein